MTWRSLQRENTPPGGPPNGSGYTDFPVYVETKEQARAQQAPYCENIKCMEFAVGNGKFCANHAIRTVAVGDSLPAVVLQEFKEIEGEGCSLGPNRFDILKESAGKTIAVFGLPGAFTPTCSAKHVPGYVEQYNELKQRGVDEIWCISVNDAFVMGAWARESKTEGKVRMLADGSAEFARATNLLLDLTAKGMGVRSLRYSMLVRDGIVKTLNVEAPGKFEVSDSATLLSQLS